MPRTRIKICGIHDLASADAAVEAGADAVGLVFVRDSARRVTVKVAQQIVQRLPAFVEPVGLFADAPTRHIREVASAVGLRTVQLHGEEHPGDVAALNDLRVIKAVAFHPSLVVESVGPWQRERLTNLAAVLFDTPPPLAVTREGQSSAAGKPALLGGSGRAFDWHALAERCADETLSALPPLVLAGGLTPENVAKAISVVRPYAVDVSSGVESSRGVKDVSRIRAFVEAVMGADAQRGAVGHRQG
ncbi:N-(5'-phosphoribosyl)anthranilate isomerase [Phycisphaerales bacterium AB-hyl4]|uniref:N-(5'-phosphoribosyl)anthranilate isomerase n=1 Tax=Natronomicrosphaera hydrolytica TaxID=3242702 RepID=A0ABV4U6C3_9BACT